VPLLEAGGLANLGALLQAVGLADLEISFPCSKRVALPNSLRCSIFASNCRIDAGVKGVKGVAPGTGAAAGAS